MSARRLMECFWSTGESNVTCHGLFSAVWAGGLGMVMDSRLPDAKVSSARVGKDEEAETFPSA